MPSTPINDVPAKYNVVKTYVNIVETYASRLYEQTKNHLN